MEAPSPTMPAPPTCISRHRIVVTLRQHMNLQCSIRMDWAWRLTPRSHSVHARCAGLDVHKKRVYGCVICCEANGDKRQEKRSFGTMTADLLSLADWLREHAVTHIV